MRYQLVVQFSADGLSDFDALIALEDQLIAELGNSVEVDGHDFGSGTANIFIFTTDPDLTFWKIRQVLTREGRLEVATVAHRPVDGEDYTVIWPKDGEAIFTIM